MSQPASRRRRNLCVESLEPRLLLTATHDPLGLQRTTDPLASGGGDTFVTVDDLALFIGAQFGGYAGAAYNPYFSSASPQNSDVVDVYNAATGQWSVTHLPHPRAGSTAAAAGHDVVVAGGTLDDNVKPVDAIDLFDSTTGTWSSAAAPVAGAFSLPAQTLAAGQSITLTIPLIAPARLAPLNYYIVAGVNGGSDSILNASPSRYRLRLDTSKPHGAAYA